MPTSWKWRAPVEDANVIKPEKSTSEKVVTLFIFAINPPGKVQCQFLKHLVNEVSITFSSLLSLNRVDLHSSPGQYRWIDVSECPFVSCELTVGVLEPFAAHQQQL